jgi:hypothetical protein
MTRKPTYSRILLFLTVIASLGACKKADEYYKFLNDQPEIITYYAKVYTIGDTLKLEGRLNPANNLQIRIGDIPATILSATKRGHFISGSMHESKQADTIDLVRIIITEAMGIGPDRQISITSNGITITPPSIEIVANSTIGYLPAPLRFIPFYTLKTGQRTLFCRNGTGAIYLWNTDGSISLLKSDGSLIQIMDTSQFQDSFGTFTVTAFNSGGVDAAEKFIYFSVTSTDNGADNAQNIIYRLCKYDIASKQLTTLNRTAYAIDSKQHTLAAAMPFEGNINAVKLFIVDGIYPDSKGNVYLRLGSHFLTKLNNEGKYSYLLKTTLYDGSFLPEILNPTTNNPYDIGKIHAIFPGVQISSYTFDAVDPENGIMYGRSSKLARYDMNNQAELYVMPDIWAAPNLPKEVHASGSFNILSGPSANSYDTPALRTAGYMPLPNDGLLVLLFQDLIEKNPAWKGQAPLLQRLDFKKRQGMRYAPGTLQTNGYKMMAGDYYTGTDDEMLNYDKDGHIYLTADTHSVIIKTAFQ